MSIAERYDYVFAGAGAAGLSLAYRMVTDSYFDHKTILLVDPSPKQENDRTWCFWEQEEGPFEELVCHRWAKARVLDHERDLPFDLDPYEYKMIRGIDFYNHVLARLNAAPNITRIQDRVQEMKTGEVHLADRGRVKADTIFDSRLLEFPTGGLSLSQHFKGLVLEADRPVFEAARINLMDFRVEQGDEVRFVYVLPMSDRKALVEYTVFGLKAWEEHEYDEPLKNYLKQHFDLTNWEVHHQECGAIPMTDQLPMGEERPGIIRIGTPAGWVKTSTGYAFRNIQYECDRLLVALKQEPFRLPDKTGRFDRYDRILLHVLAKQSYPGARAFVDLFEHHPPDRVLRFLDEDSKFSDEFKIIARSKPGPFLKAFMATLSSS